MNKELNEYVSRFNKQLKELDLKAGDQQTLQQALREKSSAVNNLFMAGMGAATLMLRLGAVYQLVKRLEEGNVREDALLTKQIIQNLRENLPSDTNWKVIWEICLDHKDERWSAPLFKPKGEQQHILEKFISFRNKYVHGYIAPQEEHLKDINKGLKVITELCEKHIALFEDFELFLKDDKYFLKTGGKEFNMHPFIQKGDKDSPYIFQGLYKQRTRPELIGVRYGDIQEQESNADYESVFAPLVENSKGSGAQIFDHSERINYYKECFVGREKEAAEIISWATSNDAENILTVYSDAGMGKGALMANVIDELKTKHKTPVLYHFCGSGNQNSLHAALYHFINQGLKYPPNGNSIWKADDERTEKKLKRLPTRYHDMIQFFQHLLDNCVSPPKSLSGGNLVILIDGLDEAAVAYPTLNISDWFYTYNEEGEAEENWMSETNIRWIFTFRQGFYRFPTQLEKKKVECLQPLQGLTAEAAEAALAKFNPSTEFLQEVVQKGAIVEQN